MQITKKLIMGLTALVLILVATTGIKSIMMTDDQGRMMMGCPFMNNTGSLCQMTIFEHIAKWQSLFSATVSLDALLLLFVVVTFVTLSRVFARALAPPERAPVYHEPLDITFFKPLLGAFSDGIIQPKLYA